MKSTVELAPCRSVVDGEVVPGLIVGSTGRKYWGREVVSCVLPPGLFGTRIGGRVRRAELTLHNGLLNQCSIGKDGNPPTPYWAVLDAAISLKRGFVRRDVIRLAVEVVGPDKAQACEFAWDVLRDHHRHVRKCHAGMAYMIETGADKKLVIRARDVGETLQYFQGQDAGRKEAEQLMASLKEEPAMAGVEGG